MTFIASNFATGFMFILLIFHIESFQTALSMEHKLFDVSFYVSRKILFACESLQANVAAVHPFIPSRIFTQFALMLLQHISRIGNFTTVFFVLCTIFSIWRYEIVFILLCRLMLIAIISIAFRFFFFLFIDFFLNLYFHFVEIDVNKIVFIIRLSGTSRG